MNISVNNNKNRQATVEVTMCETVSVSAAVMDGTAVMHESVSVSAKVMCELVSATMEASMRELVLVSAMHESVSMSVLAMQESE